MCCLGQDALWRLLPTLQETLHTHPDVALALVYSNPTKQRHAAGTCACSPLAKVESLKSLVPLRTMFEPWCSCLLHKVEWSKVLHWTQMQEWRCTTSARQLSTHSTHHGHTGAAELYAVTTVRNLDPHTWMFFTTCIYPRLCPVTGQCWSRIQLHKLMQTQMPWRLPTLLIPRTLQVQQQLVGWLLGGRGKTVQQIQDIVTLWVSATDKLSDVHTQSL